MIDTIIDLTICTKQHLIRLGFGLPPVMHMHNNKVKQLDMDIRQMTEVIANEKKDTLFENASCLFIALTSEYANVQNLTDLLQTSERLHDYVCSY